MEWDEKEADASDTIDQRGAGGGAGGGSAMPDLGDILGGVLGGQGGAGGAGGGGMGGGLGGALGGGGLGLGKKGGCLGIVMMLVAAVLLPKLLGGGGFDVSSMSKLDKIPQFPSGGELPSEGAPSDASIPASEDPDAELASFAKVLITDTNDVWQDQFERRIANTVVRSWCCSPVGCKAVVVLRVQKWGPSTAQQTAWSISIWGSFKSWTSALVRPAISPRPM